jgi:hypothetical protein
VQLVRGDGGAVGTEGARATCFQEAQALHGIDVKMGALAARARPSPRDVRDGLARAQLVVHQHDCHDRGFRPPAATTASALTTPSAAGDHVQGNRRRRAPGAPHDRRVLERAHDQVATA